MVVKFEFLKFASQVGTSIILTIRSKKHLGALVGSATFRKGCIETKVAEWLFCRKCHQAAYVAFLVGYRQKFNYIFRTIDNLGDYQIRIERVIRFRSIPAFSNGKHCSDIDRCLLALPTKYGGLGIINVL